MALSVEVPNHMSDRIVPLANWNSIALVLSHKKTWLSSSCLLLKPKETCYIYDYHELKKKSIEQQCQIILDRYGWIPNKLSDDQIKHSMKKKQIQKYGDVLREFVKKYNKTTKAMKLSKKQQMPKNYELSDILTLSRFVNSSSPRSLKKLLNSMDEETLRQLLVNNMNYYLDAKHREKYLNHGKQNRAHHSILQTIKKKSIRNSKKNKLNYIKNRFDKLCVELTSYILSFGDESDVSKASVCCHTLFKASKQPNARTVVTIDAQKLGQQNTFCQSEINEHYRTPSICLKNTFSGYPMRFERYFEDVMLCGKVSSLSMGATTDKLGSCALKVCESMKNCRIETFHSGDQMDLPDKLLFALHTLKVQGLGVSTLRNVQRLLINI